MPIRRAGPEDAPAILSLVRELAEFERSEHLVEATEAHVRESFFSGEPRVTCELLETPEGELAGFAVWFLNYSTWTGTHGIYLEDLYVRAPLRGRGYAREALAHLARVCVDNGYQRFQWSVLDWNQRAIDFYESLGAEATSEWIGYRLSGAALASLAGL